MLLCLPLASNVGAEFAGGEGYVKQGRRGIRQEIELDVVVIGYGCAGAVAAMEAHDRGSRVILLEKMAKGGGATFISNGGIFVPTAMEFSEYLYRLCAGTTERDLIETFVRDAMKIEDYIRPNRRSVRTMGEPGGRYLLSPSWTAELAERALRQVDGQRPYQGL